MGVVAAAAAGVADGAEGVLAVSVMFKKEWAAALTAAVAFISAELVTFPPCDELAKSCLIFADTDVFMSGTDCSVRREEFTGELTAFGALSLRMVVVAGELVVVVVNVRVVGGTRVDAWLFSLPVLELTAVVVFFTLCMVVNEGMDDLWIDGAATLAALTVGSVDDTVIRFLGVLVISAFVLDCALLIRGGCVKHI